MGAKSKETHQKFLQYLKESEEAVWFIARWFCANHKRTIQIHPSTQAKTHQDWKAHVDKGDLYMKPPDHDSFLRYEVKRLGVDFTGAMDWPFREKFIVCAKHSYDNAAPPPSSYLILNRSMTHMAVARGSKKEHWYVESKIDGRTGVGQEFYFCPMVHIIFHSLT